VTRRVVAYAVVFIADEQDVDRTIERAILFRDQGRAERYMGDPTKPHDQPMRVRPLIFGDEGCCDGTDA
jgi:hypothetical protein